MWITGMETTKRQTNIVTSYVWLQAEVRECGFRPRLYAGAVTAPMQYAICYYLCVRSVDRHL